MNKTIDGLPKAASTGKTIAEHRMNPHSCRYTLATRGHSLGIANDTLSKILGHADFDVTSDIYIQADISKLHQEMSKLDPQDDSKDTKSDDCDHTATN